MVCQFIRKVSIGLTGLTCTVGCDAESPLRVVPEVHAGASDHFQVYVESEELASECSEVPDLFEEYFAVLNEQLPSELHPSEDRVISYMKYSSSVSFEQKEACPPGASACYSSDYIFTHSYFHQHELLHAFMDDAVTPSVVLEEGLATAVSCNGRGTDDDWLPVPLDQLFKWIGEESNLEKSAAVLVANLWRTGGAEPFSKLWHASSEIDLKTAIAEIYGTPASEFYRTSRDGGCLRFWECAAPKLKVDEGYFRARNRCGIRDHHLLTLSEPTFVVANLRALGSCDGRGTLLSVDEAFGQSMQSIMLNPGTYYLSTDGLPGALFAYAREPLDETLARSCDSPLSQVESALGDLQGTTVKLDPELLGGRELIFRPGRPNIGPATLSATCDENISVKMCRACDANDCTDICGRSAELPDSPTVRIQAFGQSPGTVLFWR